MPIHIKHVHSCFSYQLAIYQKYILYGHESPSGYGPLLSSIIAHYIRPIFIEWQQKYIFASVGSKSKAEAGPALDMAICCENGEPMHNSMGSSRPEYFVSAV